MMDARLFIITAILILAVVGVIYLTMTRTMNPTLNRVKYQKRWLEIENSLDRNNQASYQMAVLNADKLLDHALKERRLKGESMGERMKSAQKLWSNADHIWAAHKVRNKLAHESEFQLTREIALRTLAAFKKALKDLGAI